MSLAYFARNAASAERARERMQREGVTMNGHALWTDKERAVLVKFKGNYDAMCKRLPHRTRIAIRSQCALMGLQQSRHVWLASDISKLRRMYKTASVEELCAAFPHSTWINIQQAARYRGFRRRGRQPYKLTGNSGLDAVRRKCYEIGWTMPDLDSAARTGTYFKRCGWIGKKINHRALGRAIEALDGVVQAQWR